MTNLIKLYEEILTESDNDFKLADIMIEIKKIHKKWLLSGNTTSDYNDMIEEIMSNNPNWNREHVESIVRDYHGLD